MFAVALVASAVSVLGATPASADAHVTSLDHVEGSRWTMTVYSPAMGREIPLDVIRPAGGAPAPTLYLLNGAGGGEDGANWQSQTDVVDFFADKNVNVVTPAQGLGSYYTDWIARDPVVGQPMWATFLTDELPGVVNGALGTNGRNAVAGVSMSATSVLDLAIDRPGLYDGVASLSGCARTATPEAQLAIRGVVRVANGGNADNMWGPPNAPAWLDHDPYLRAEELRGTELYISSGSGLPGRFDTPEAPRHAGAPPLLDQILVGGAIEAATRYCTVSMADRLRDLGIPATIDLPGDGTHSWLYWQDQLHKAWPVLAQSVTR
ncbi:esterase [Rhodococcoides trifolii]|uniref:Esterase n=2 Tax=Rhodococcoides trifolii TaxID=908250 RepID=A0A917LHC1_9NOCA|nr:esterase [Rhodococcus trifolii]